MFNSKGKITLILILSSLFGLASGLVGTILASAYILENSFKVPFFGEIKFSNDNYGTSGVVISNPRKVVVEQNAMIAEVANTAGDSIVGIFKTITSADEETDTKTQKVAKQFSVNDYYNLENELGQGLIITSDGWVLSNFVPEELKLALKIKTDNDELISSIFENYVVITRDEKIILVDNIVYDKHLNCAFWHLVASNLPVKKFSSEKDVSSGQLAVLINWDKWIWPATILNINRQELVYSSDEYLKEITFSQVPESHFFGSFVFDLNGNLLAMVNNEGKVKLINNYLPAIDSLLRNKEILRASLGVYYTDLADFIGADNTVGKGALISKGSSGVAVVKDSPAYLVGLKEGDIITAIDGTELDEDVSLNDIIDQHQVGDKITLEYLRDGEKNSVVLMLDELE